MVGDSDVVLAGGTENMSQAPYAVRDIRWGTRFGSDIKVIVLYTACSVDQCMYLSDGWRVYPEIYGCLIIISIIELSSINKISLV